MRTATAAMTLLALLPSICHAANKVESYDDGKVHLRYGVDSQDRKDGDYQELFESGKPKVHGSYLRDQKTGVWTTYSPDDKPLEIAGYKADLLDGPYQFNFPSGHPQEKTTYTAGDISGPVTAFDEKGNTLFTVRYPIPLATVQKAYKKWAPASRPEPTMTIPPVLKAPYAAGAVSTESQDAALKYVMLYRYLSNLPTQMSIDPARADQAQHGAVVLHKLGHLSHKPDKPDDMDDAFFKTGYAGTSSSNICQGARNLFDEIDDYMDDSDAHNVDRVGHRQWILTPGLQKTGFGYAGGFSCLSVFDGADHPSKFLYIAYPGEGYYPHDMVRDNIAWSLSVSAAKATVDKADLEITVTSVDDHFGVKESKPAKIVAVAMNPTGAWPCIIFRPALDPMGPGKYIVQVKGIKTTAGQPAPLAYMVDIVEMVGAGHKNIGHAPRHKRPEQAPGE